MLAQVGFDRGDTQGRDTGFELDDGAGDLAEASIGHTDDGGGGDRFMQQQCTFDGFRQELETAAHDGAVGAAAMEHESVFIDHGDIGGADPVRSDARRDHFENAFLARRQHFTGFRILHAQLCAGQGASDAAEFLCAPLRIQIRRHCRHRAAEFRRAV